VVAILGKSPVELAGPRTGAGHLVSYLANLGTYLISLTAIGLVLLGIQAYRNQKVRRVVGVIWDVATFWPRAAHPLGVPCYAERVVPELVHRTTWLATMRGGVVLSGHSQGSVLAAATVLQLPKPARDGTALLTYGSPLRRLYVRAFPAYFNDDVLASIGARLADPDHQPRWTNLWRRTDPIGGHVDTEGLGGRPLPAAAVPGALTARPDAAVFSTPPQDPAQTPAQSPAPAEDPPTTPPTLPAGGVPPGRGAARIAHCADVRFVDPTGFDPCSGDRVPPPIQGHSNYQTSFGFAEAVTALLARLPRPGK
jgi:hypothetical protein